MASILAPSGREQAGSGAEERMDRPGSRLSARGRSQRRKVKPGGMSGPVAGYKRRSAAGIPAGCLSRSGRPAGAHEDGGGLRPIAGAELLPDVRDVLLDRPRLDVELLPDVPIRPARGDEVEPLPLPPRQGRRSRGSLRRRTESGV